MAVGGCAENSVWRDAPREQTDVAAPPSSRGVWRPWNPACDVCLQSGVASSPGPLAGAGTDGGLASSRAWDIGLLPSPRAPYPLSSAVRGEDSRHHRKSPSPVLTQSWAPTRVVGTERCRRTLPVLGA